MSRGQHAMSPPTRSPRQAGAATPARLACDRRQPIEGEWRVRGCSESDGRRGMGQEGLAHWTRWPSACCAAIKPKIIVEAILAPVQG